MELEWEQERQSSPTAGALAGAFLGAALGADCFLAAAHLAGGMHKKSLRQKKAEREGTTWSSRGKLLATM